VKPSSKGFRMKTENEITQQGKIWESGEEVGRLWEGQETAIPERPLKISQ
jgi:hypothetical protein